MRREVRRGKRSREKGFDKRRMGEDWAEVRSRLRIGESSEENGLKGRVRSEEGGGGQGRKKIEDG